MASTIGLDIGTSAVRAVQLSVGGRGPATLDRIGQVLLPPGAVRDGELVDEESVAESIKLLWSRYGFKGKKVALGVANQQVVVRQVDLPYLPEDDLRETLAYQVQEYIPIPVEQALLDFNVITNYETEGGQQLSRILLVAAERSMVDKIVAAVMRAKLEPVLIDLDGFALLRSLAPEHLLGDGGGEMLVDVGAAVTNIVVHEGGAPRFVRILLMGGNGITDGLVTGLGMTYEAAEQAKVSIGVPDPAATLDDTARMIGDRAGRFIDEIRGSLDYYTAQADSTPVQRVVLTGGASQLPNLYERLGSVLRVPVERGHPMQELKIGKVGLEPEQLVEAEPYLAVAIGLALGAAG